MQHTVALLLTLISLIIMPLAAAGPLRAAEPTSLLLAQAAPAKGSVIGEHGVTAPESTGFGSNFSAGIREVDFWYEWNNVEPGHTVQVRWLKDGAVISHAETALTTPAGKNQSALAFSNGALPNGKYAVELIDAGKPFTHMDFTIGMNDSGMPQGGQGTSAGGYEAGVAAVNAGDIPKAVRLLEPTAQGGDTRSQVLLGLLYANADSVKDGAKAERYLRPAAERGDAQAQQALGSLYVDGTAAPQDVVQGYMWEVLAIPKLDGQMRDLAVQFRETASQRMTPAQREEGEARAKQWRPTTQ
jgi:hypothetical protein